MKIQMKIQKVLINVSNHPSTGWSEEQRKDWDEIVDIPFPHVDPEWNERDESFEKTVDNLTEKIIEEQDRQFKKKAFFVAVMLQGEFSLCYAVINKIVEMDTCITLAIPTTRREVVEEKTGNEVRKISKFRFVRWRYVSISC